MKGRLSLLGILLVALFAVLLVKSDRAQEFPPAVDRTVIDQPDDVPATVVPRDSEPQQRELGKAKKRANRRSQGISETQVPASAGEETTAPARMRIDVPPPATPQEETPRESIPPEVTPPDSTQGSAAETGGFTLTLPKEEEIDESFDDEMPFPWMDQVQESQPGFVDPNRLDARTPSGDPILARPAPTGPGAGFYDPNNRFADPD